MNWYKDHIFIGADHRGVELRVFILSKLEKESEKGKCWGYSPFGANDSKEEDDYTDTALAVAQCVSTNSGTFGILICGSGAGVDMVANKIPGIRSALVFDEARAKQAREHEDANIICLPADVLEPKEAWKIVKTFLDTPFSNEKRHQRRIKKIELIERFGFLPRIIPAILAITTNQFKDQIQKIKTVKPGFHWVQIDFMDNIFVHNKTIPPDDIEDLRITYSRKKEAHLMVMYPMQWLKDLIKTGIDRIIFPLESKDNLLDVIEQIRGYAGHVQIGLALNPQTPVSEAEGYLDKIDLVLLMSVEPGKQGQQFMPGVIDKIKELNKLRSRKNNFIIEVDGGITTGVAKDLVEAGASNLVVGSHLLEGDVKKNLEDFYKAIYE